MLDGAFSGLGVAMGVMMLKVAELVTRPDDEHFHYGYSHFAPLMNVVKSLLMLVLCVAALPLPAKILAQNAREVLLFAPDTELQRSAEERFRGAVRDLPIDGMRLSEWLE